MGKTKEDVCDVRIVTYDTCKGKVANITFHDNLSEILGEEGCRVSLICLPKYPNRLYFRPWSKNAITKKTAVKLSSGKLQYARKDSVDICDKFVGEYQLQFDDMGEKLYYVNKEKASQPGYRGGNSKIPHPNYTVGKRVAIPKQRPLAIPKITKVEVKQNSEDNVVLEEFKDNNVVLELLNVLDTYDTNEAVYKAGHTLISTIKEMLK